MTKQELLKELTAHMARTVHTWEDWYRHIDMQTKIGFQSDLPPLIVSATLQMYAFMQAMREMPDEGDISVLVSRTCHIVVMEIDKRLGVEFAHLMLGDRLADGTAADATPEGEPSPEVVDMVAAMIRKVKG